LNRFPTFTAWFEGASLWLGEHLGLGLGRGARRFDTAIFLRQLASTLRAGIPLPQGLAFIGEEYGPRIRRKRADVRQRVESGEALSRAVDTLPENWLPRPARAAIAAAEQSGTLPAMLEVLAAESEQQAAFRARVRNVLVYPIAVLILGLIVIVTIVWKVVPTFAALYATLGHELPNATRFTIRLANFFAIYAGPLLWIVLLFGLWQIMGTLNSGLPLVPGSRLRRLLGRLPVARTVLAAIAEVRFSRTLALLLEAGLPLPRALEFCAAAVGGGENGATLIAASRRIEAGEKPSEVLGGLPFLSPAFLWFLGGAERRGDFVEVTRAMADVAEQRFRTSLELAQRVLEPACILALGLFVGLVVVATYVPMFALLPYIGN